MKTIFISDLHLDKSLPQITKRFFSYLESLKQQQVDSLYILGDLFEYWIGDDCKTKLSKQVASNLLALSKTGIKIYFIHGNRDFLLGEFYAKKSGFRLLNEHTVIDLYSVRTLIMHGDTLCTDDIDYMNFRKKVRNPEWAKKILSTPIFIRKIIAWNMRRKSKKANKNKINLKARSIMDVNQQTVENIMSENNAQELIHGHIHKIGTFKYSLENNTYFRYVLKDWSNSSGCALEVTKNSKKFISI